MFALGQRRFEKLDFGQQQRPQLCLATVSAATGSPRGLRIAAAMPHDPANTRPGLSAQPVRLVRAIRSWMPSMSALAYD